MALKQEAAAYLGDDEVSVAASVRENLVRNEETAVLIEWMVANLGDEARGLVTEPHTDPYEHAISLARAANGLVESLDVFSPDEKASYRQRLGESISRVFVQDRDLLLDPEMRFFVDAMVAFLPSGLPASATTIVNISSAARALLPGLQDTALRTEHRSIGELQELLIGHIQTIAFDIGQRRFVSDFETFSQEDDVRLRATLQNEIKNKQIRFKVKTNELDPKARKLRDAIEVDALKHALDEARTSGSMPDLIEAENQAFATIVREIHKYPSQDFL